MGVGRLLPVLPRYVIREILIHFVGVLAVVLGIFLIRRFGSLLTDAAEGALPANVILHLLALRTIMAFPSLLPVVLYLAVLLGLGRFFQDNEITALEACGVAPGRVPYTVLAFALFAATVIGGMSLSVRPWAAGRFEQVKTHAARDLDVGALSPGRFYEIGHRGAQVIFADHRTADGRMGDVFLQDRHDGQVSILVSNYAAEHVDEATGYRFLTLVDGYRYDLRPKTGRYEITRYRTLTIRTALQAETAGERRQKTRSTLALLRSDAPADIAELQWRLAMPVSTLLLVLIALPLSRVDPYRGKYAKLFAAILLYMAYRHLLGAAKDWVAHGTLPPFPGIWGVHALCLAGILAVFAAVPAARWWRRTPGRLRHRAARWQADRAAARDR